MKSFTTWLTSRFASKPEPLEQPEASEASAAAQLIMQYRQQRLEREEASKKAVLAKFKPFTVVQTPSGSAYAYVKPDGALSPSDSSKLLVSRLAEIERSKYEAWTTPVDQWVEVGK